jgi:hypothetical protein
MQLIFRQNHEYVLGFSKGDNVVVVLPCGKHHSTTTLSPSTPTHPELARV